MSRNDVIDLAERRNMNKQIPEFAIGDTVDVAVKISEGDKTRLQTFSGIVISRKHGGLRETFTVRRIVDGEGVERTFPIHSPLVASIQVKRHGVARRAKLYFLRDRVGKATRLKERIVAEVPEVATEEKKKGRKRGAKAKAERKARAAETAAQKQAAKKAKKAEATAEAPAQA
jgi:large subunit ribosomal protein L19